VPALAFLGLFETLFGWLRQAASSYGTLPIVCLVQDLLPWGRMTGSLATVLICDDEPSLRELIRISLGGSYSFAEADDGQKSLEIARSLRPDVVILDMMMPRLSGLDVLREIRGDRALSATQVIVLTAQPATKDEALRSGADVVMVKPFEPTQIQAAVKELLESRP
jgi:DNA-binding response OmpR family regulator